MAQLLLSRPHVYSGLTCQPNFNVVFCSSVSYSLEKAEKLHGKQSQSATTGAWQHPVAEMCFFGNATAPDVSQRIRKETHRTLMMTVSNKPSVF